VLIESALPPAITLQHDNWVWLLTHPLHVQYDASVEFLAALASLFDLVCHTLLSPICISCTWCTLIMPVMQLRYTFNNSDNLLRMGAVVMTGEAVDVRTLPFMANCPACTVWVPSTVSVVTTALRGSWKSGGVSSQNAAVITGTAVSASCALSCLIASPHVGHCGVAPIQII
jgi:hypothetical protein